VSAIKVKILDGQDQQAWNRFVDFSPWGDILQMWQWGELKKTQGWKPLRIGVIKDGFLILAAQILLKPVPFLGNYAHVPHGPVFHKIEDLELALPHFVEFITHLSKTYDFAVVEIEPKIGKLVENLELELTPQTQEKLNNLSHFYNPKVIEIFQKNKFQITGRNVEPIHKLYYDLDEVEDTLLSHCHKNTRYNIKLAQKKGVVITEYLPDSPQIKQKLTEFFDLVKITQDRAKGYPVRDLKTYVKLFELFQGTDNLSLFEASFNGETIVMNISQRNKFWSSSFYAGSNRKYTNVKAPYLIRWASILRAKQSGSKTYDFWGIVPSSKHAGYSDHKLSFGGTRIDNYGLLALPINPIKYELWDFAIWARTESKTKTREFIFNSKQKIGNLVSSLFKSTKSKVKQIFDKKPNVITSQKAAETTNQLVIANIEPQEIKPEIIEVKNPLAVVEITAKIEENKDLSEIKVAKKLSKLKNKNHPKKNYYEKNSK